MRDPVIADHVPHEGGGALPPCFWAGGPHAAIGTPLPPDGDVADV